MMRRTILLVLATILLAGCFVAPFSFTGTVEDYAMWGPNPGDCAAMIVRMDQPMGALIALPACRGYQHLIMPVGTAVTCRSNFNGTKCKPVEVGQ